MGPSLSVLFDFLICWFYWFFLFFFVLFMLCMLDNTTVTLMLVQWVPCVRVGLIVFLLLLLRISDNVTL